MGDDSAELLCFGLFFGDGAAEPLDVPCAGRVGGAGVVAAQRRGVRDAAEHQEQRHGGQDGVDRTPSSARGGVRGA